MPIFRLWRASDDKTFDDKDARDEKHALELFGHELKVTLTLAEGTAAPDYLMGRVDMSGGWTKPPDIPVYEVAESPKKDATG